MENNTNNTAAAADAIAAEKAAWREFFFAFDNTARIAARAKFDAAVEARRAAGVTDEEMAAAL